MPPYDPDPQIIQKSLEELEFILNWVRKRGETVENPVTVLVGGWAVDAYNPWYGSIDIDLVTNNRTKHSLMRILVTEREYEHSRGLIQFTSQQTTDQSSSILPAGKNAIHLKEEMKN